MDLFGLHSHLLLYDKPHVNTLSGHDHPKSIRLREAEDGLILGLHDSAADKAKRETSSNVQILLLNRNPILDPPWGGMRNQ